jgi:hypothetical protein
MHGRCGTFFQSRAPDQCEEYGREFRGVSPWTGRLVLADVWAHAKALRGA